jgi:hypothetical protein
MKRILTSVFVVPLLACALGEIDGGGLGTAGAGIGAGGTGAMVGAAGAGGRTGDAGSTGAGGTASGSKAGTGGITAVVDGGPNGGATGGQADDGGTIVDPYDTPPVCTSKTTWTRANHGDQKMNPGLACISCHTTMNKGPRFAVAGTLFPTAHEPDLCNGGTVVTSARVVITGSNGQSQTLTPNSAGNFNFEGTIAKPYTAKVTYMGRERAMVESQTSGDCNDCHTQNGAMRAPGRIMLP